MEESANANETALEALSREELLEKCKSLISAVEKVKQSKDGLVEENNAMKDALANSITQKEADEKVLNTMQEMLQQFTDQKLAMSTELNMLQLKEKSQLQQICQKDIENESLHRQLERMTEENETLLNDIERIEAKLQQMNVLSKEQRQHLTMLEKEMNNMKEMESQNASLLNQNILLQEQQKFMEAKCISATNSLEELSKQYNINEQVFLKEQYIFNALKNSFIEVHRKLKKLQECKNVVLKTQLDYSKEIGLWQNKIIKVVKELGVHCSTLQLGNERFSEQQQQKDLLNGSLHLSIQLSELQSLCDAVYAEHKETNQLWEESKKDNIILKNQLSAITSNAQETIFKVDGLSQQLQDVQPELSNKTEYIKTLESEIVRLRAYFPKEEGTEIYLQTGKYKNLLAHLTEMEKICSEKSLENGRLRTALEETHNALEKIEQENIALLEQVQSQPVQEKWFEEIKTQIETETYEGNKQYLLNLAHPEQEKIQNEYISEINEVIKQKEFTILEKEQSEAKMGELNMPLRKERNEFESLQQSKLTVENQPKATIDEFTKECNNSKKELEVEIKAAKEDKELNKVRGLNEEPNVPTIESIVECNYDIVEDEKALVLQIDKPTDELAELRQKYEDLYINFERKQCDHANLLDEMRELNEALKERGDVISRLQENQLELLGELKINNIKLQETEQLLEERQQQLVRLKEETLHKREQVPALVEDVQFVKSGGGSEDSIRLREIDESFEEKYNKLRALAMKLKKKIQEQNTQINSLETELQEKEQQFNIIKTENQKLKSSRKQANVLNLEIEAAEKTLKENAEKLNAKTQELATMHDQLNQQKQNLKQLHEEKTILEAQKAKEVANSGDLKKQVDLLQQQIKTGVCEQQKTSLYNKELEEKIKQNQRKLDEMNTELLSNMEKQTIEMEKVQEQLRLQERENLQLLEEFKCVLLQQKTTTQQLADLRADYAEYKLKAQTVLRKQQSAQDSIRLPELHDEFKNLQQKQEDILAQLTEREQYCEELKKELIMLTDDYEHIQQRNKELSHLLAEAKQHNEAISLQYRQQSLQQQQNLQSQRLQIEQLQVSHQKQLNDLHMQLQQHRQQKVDKDVTYSEANKMDFFLMEREAAEGSEEVDLSILAANRKISVSSRPSQHDFIPLDELLSAPNCIISDTVNSTAGTTFEHGYSGVDSSNNELLLIRERLQKQDRQVRHLTALLAESEQDLAKLSQMNDMLKEELRRQERSVGREEHMHNSEYLKNIIIKFLTLNQNDERVRLVPVLNTILKLSRNEVELLNNVAKGQLSNSKAWSSFLPWSGGAH